eukprot:97378-Prymnesium_polylepis.1
MAYSARSSTALMKAAHHDAERVGELCPRSKQRRRPRARCVASFSAPRAPARLRSPFIPNPHHA